MGLAQRVNKVKKIISQILENKSKAEKVLFSVRKNCQKFLTFGNFYDIIIMVKKGKSGYNLQILDSLKIAFFY